MDENQRNIWENLKKRKKKKIKMKKKQRINK